MGQDSEIQWTTHTCNFWRGCTKVSPGCQFCYAEAGSKRNPLVLGQWGPKGHRTVAAESYWANVPRWDKAAAKAGERHRVFSLSYGDFWEEWEGPMVDTQKRTLFCRYAHRDQWTFDTEAVPYEQLGFSKLSMMDVRARAFDAMEATKNLDWLLLTKRPENAPRMISLITGRSDYFDGQPQYWLGTSVENREHGVPRIAELRKIPASIRFLSVEPLLEHLGELDLTGIHWVIVGGESGYNARPTDVDWVRSIARQCADQRVSLFVKQLGANPYEIIPESSPWEVCNRAVDYDLKLKDSHGGDWSEWPEDLMVREFPRIAS